MLDLGAFLIRPLTLLGIASVILLVARKFGKARSSGIKGVPWVGRDEKLWFADLRASLSTFTTSYELLHEGYTRYNKKGTTYMIPDLGGTPQLVLPIVQMPWVLDQPDSVLSASGFHYDNLAGDYCFDSPEILRDPYHERAVHRYLPRRMAAVIPDVEEEVIYGFDNFWGTDTQKWKEVNLWDFVLFIIPRTVMRLTVGSQLCRNDEFIETAIAVTESVPKCSLVISHTHRRLRPLVGPLITRSHKALLKKLSTFTIPVIEARLAAFERQKRDPEFNWTPPNDFISWHIQVAMEDNRPEELKVKRVAARIVPILFAVIHTTSISFMNCLLDLLSSKTVMSDLEKIREESSTLLNECGGAWTKSALGQCHLADSALRESMRVSNFMSRNVSKKVNCPEGITNEFEGWHAPQGVHVAFDQHNVHHDAAYYANPMEYDPFRFAPTAEARALRVNDRSESNATQTLASDKAVSRGKTDLISTSDIWLPFSRGRHTCPGRFLVAPEVKIFLAYMTMHYDIEPLLKRPANKTLAAVNIPTPDTIINVRRK